MGTLTLQDTRLSCGKRMAYAAIGEELDAEPVIGFSDRKDQHTKTSTLTLQDARLLCDKRMAYAAVGGSLYAEPAIRLPGRMDSIQKRAPRLCRMPNCYATNAWSMLWSKGG